MATGNCVFCLLLLSLIATGKMTGGETVNCNKSFVLNSDTTVGVLQSYNFPFNYRANLSCHYTVYLQSANTAHICFLFRRFDTKFGDLLTFRNGSVVNSYHRDGQLYNGSSNLTNLWAGNFCWKTSNNKLIITFKSLNTSLEEFSTKNGFYATFWANYTNIDISHASLHKEDKKVDAILMDKMAPCLSEQWTCFNRRCIQKNQLCDAVNTCGDLSDEMYCHAGCKTGSWGPSLYGCDFSSGHSCGLLGLAQVGWIIEEQNENEERGPSSDHTTGNSRGYYIRTSFGKSGEDLALTSKEVILAPNTTYCLSFWYHMTGPRVGRLNVYYVDLMSQFVTPGLQRPLWTRTANYHHRWLHGEILVKDEINYGNIYFEGKRSNYYNASIAIDDISLRISNHCRSDDISCNFEFGWCGWKPDFRFLRIQGNQTLVAGPDGDPISSKGDQIYAAVELSPRTPAVSITSPLYAGYVNESGFHVACLQVWLYHSDVPMNHYASNVSINTRGFDGTEIIHESLRPMLSPTFDDPFVWYTRQWKEFAVDLYHNKPFSVIIQSERRPSHHITLGIDNPVITEGPCDLVELQSCLLTQFRCSDGSCIDMDLICDGKPHCVDGGDEEPPVCHHDKGLVLPIGAIAGITLMACVVIIMILLWVLLNSKSRPKWCLPLHPMHRSSDTNTHDLDDQEVAPEPVLYQQPPDYAECVNNPMYRRNVSHDSSLKSDSIEVLPGVHTPLPPSYDRIEKGEFKTFAVTDKGATHKLRRFIRSKSRDALDSTFDDSSSTLTEINFANVTDLEHRVPTGPQQVVAEVRSREIVNPAYSGSTDNISSSDDASTISRPAFRILRAHGHALGKAVSRTGSNASNRTLPRYPDIPQPPAYDNLSFCGKNMDLDVSRSNTAPDGPSTHPSAILESPGKEKAPIILNVQRQRKGEQKRNDLRYNRTMGRSSGTSSLHGSDSDRLSRRLHEVKNKTQERSLGAASHVSKSCTNISISEESKLDDKPTYSHSKSTTFLNQSSNCGIPYNAEHPSKRSNMVAAQSMPNLIRLNLMEECGSSQEKYSLAHTTDPSQNKSKVLLQQTRTEGSGNLSALMKSQENGPLASKNHGISTPRAKMYSSRVSRSQHNLYQMQHPENDVQKMRRAKSQMTLTSCSESFI